MGTARTKGSSRRVPCHRNPPKANQLVKELLMAKRTTRKVVFGIPAGQFARVQATSEFMGYESMEEYCRVAAVKAAEADRARIFAAGRDPISDVADVPREFRDGDDETVIPV